MADGSYAPFVRALLDKHPDAVRERLVEDLVVLLLEANLLDEVAGTVVAERIVDAGWIHRPTRAAVTAHLTGGEEKGVYGVAPYFEVTPAGALLLVGDDDPGDGSVAIAPGCWTAVTRTHLGTETAS